MTSARLKVARPAASPYAPPRAAYVRSLDSIATAEMAARRARPAVAGRRRGAVAPDSGKVVPPDTAVRYRCGTPRGSPATPGLTAPVTGGAPQALPYRGALGGRERSTPAEGVVGDVRRPGAGIMRLRVDVGCDILPNSARSWRGTFG